MNLNNLQKNKGFTIVEALVAIFILSVSISAMLGITSSSITSSRYSSNEITANYLLEEIIDSIRNSRDTIVFQDGNSWDTFLSLYGYPSSYCFSTKGCSVSMENFLPYDPSPSLTECPNSSDSGISCPALKYNENPGEPLNGGGYTPNSFYSVSGSGDNSIFKRELKMEIIDTDKLHITAIVEWMNGTKLRKQTLDTILTNWQL